MKPATFRYERPDSLAQAVELRAEHGTDSSLLAGGQSLIPMLNFRLARPDVLIDLGAVAELRHLQPRDGGIAIGAMTRQRDLELDAHALAANPLIEETLHNVAHSVVRNRGTVGGSIAHADAAAELPTLFATLDGKARVTGPRGDRIVTGSELFAFHLTTTLESDEMLCEVWLPDLEPATGWAFEEFARRHGDYALAGVCATVTLADDGSISAARLGYCGVSSTPVRCPEAERALLGAAPGPQAFAQAAQLAESVVDTADDATASQAYRRHLVNRLTLRALRTCHARASEGRSR